MQLSEEHLRARLAAHEPKRVPATEATRYAAVAAILRFDSAAQVLLIKRAQHPQDPWSGHMAFPGGRKDDTDVDLLATACRETAEEVGLDLARSAQLVGRLDDVQAVSRARLVDLVIVPQVFVLHEQVVVAVDHGEVDEALWAELGPMMSGSCATVRPYVHRGTTLELPAFRVGQHVVWGLTYQMLQQLFAVLRASS